MEKRNSSCRFVSVSLADDVLSLMVSVCVVVNRNCFSSVGVFQSVGIKVGFLSRVVGVLLVGDRWVWCVVAGIGCCQCR